MRTLALTCCVVLSGCFTSINNPTDDGGGQQAGADLSQAGGSKDLAFMGSSTDMANHAGDLATTDLAGNGTLAFGADCVNDTQCMSGLCRGFQMQTIHKCTKTCAPATAAADCPNPPSTGQCTNNNYCKF